MNWKSDFSIALVVVIINCFIACGGGGSSNNNTSDKDDNNDNNDNNSQLVWTSTVVQDLDDERDGGGGLLTPNIRVVKGLNDEVHLSYINDSIDPTTKYTIYYMVWDTERQALKTTHLLKNVVDIDSCASLAMALDQTGNPVIAYKGGQIRECGQEEQSDAMVSIGNGNLWSEYTGATGYVERNPVFTDGHAGREVSVAFDSNGDIHLAYQFLYEGCDSMNYQYPDMCYVHMDANNLNTLAEEEYIEGNDYVDNNVQNNAGNFCSLVLDNNDAPIVFYYAVLADKTKGLRVARKVSGNWEKEWVEKDCEIGGISAVWNDAEQTVAVAYYVKAYSDGRNDTVDCLKYAGDSSGGWQIQMVDDYSRCGQYPSLAFDTTGKPAIAYYDIKNHSGYARQDLKQASFDGSSWNRETIASDGDIGKYNTIWFDDDDQIQICTYSETQNAIYMYSKQ